jgi:hypothetical protein
MKKHEEHSARPERPQARSTNELSPTIRPNEVLCTAYITRPELCKSAGSC